MVLIVQKMAMEVVPVRVVQAQTALVFQTKEVVVEVEVQKRNFQNLAAKVAQVREVPAQMISGCQMKELVVVVVVELQISDCPENLAQEEVVVAEPLAMPYVSLCVGTVHLLTKKMMCHLLSLAMVAAVRQGV